MFKNSDDTNYKNHALLFNQRVNAKVDIHGSIYKKISIIFKQDRWKGAFSSNPIYQFEYWAVQKLSQVTIDLLKYIKHIHIIQIQMLSGKIYKNRPLQLTLRDQRQPEDISLSLNRVLSHPTLSKLYTTQPMHHHKTQMQFMPTQPSPESEMAVSEADMPLNLPCQPSSSIAEYLRGYEKRCQTKISRIEHRYQLSISEYAGMLIEKEAIIDELKKQLQQKQKIIEEMKRQNIAYTKRSSLSSHRAHESPRR